MKIVLNILGALSLLAGIGMMVMAYLATTILNDARSASAVQVTQVYSEASFYGTMATAAFALAGVLILSSILASITQQTEVISFWGGKIEK